ncbi:hypothetical protein [Dyella sp.]|uniref:hypothetical protein n=1 Tax=Dyella sp. TaxID=1869338 RepID=UPI002ED4BB52
MNPQMRRLRSYRALLRLARVRESLAAEELAKAAREEREKREAHEQVQAQRAAVAEAGHSQSANANALDLGRLQMLSMLDAALYEREQLSGQQLAVAQTRRHACAQANAQASRYRERVDERLVQASAAVRHEHAAKLGEESLALWIQARGESA